MYSIYQAGSFTCRAKTLWRYISRFQQFSRRAGTWNDITQQSLFSSLYLSGAGRSAVYAKLTINGRAVKYHQYTRIACQSEAVADRPRADPRVAHPAPRTLSRSEPFNALQTSRTSDGQMDQLAISLKLQAFLENGQSWLYRPRPASEQHQAKRHNPINL